MVSEGSGCGLQSTHVGHRSSSELNIAATSEELNMSSNNALVLAIVINSESKPGRV